MLGQSKLIDKLENLVNVIFLFFKILLYFKKIKLKQKYNLFKSFINAKLTKFKIFHKP